MRSPPLVAVGWTWITPLRAVITFVWFVRALRAFHERTWFATIWRAIFIAFAHMLATLVFFALVAIPWVMWTEGR